jgi:hypothetical protein
VKLSPVNVRPALRIRPDWNAKALGLVASGYARMWAAHGDPATRAHSMRWLAWLTDHHSGEGAELAWGYPFPVQTRFFAYAGGTPNTIATSFVAHALLDGVELLDDERWAEPALGAARFLVSRMRGNGYFRYVPGEDELVHNANALACGVLARTARVLGEDSVLEPARTALARTLDAQREDGSWPYAESADGGWVDNFHTAYVLESLALAEGLHPELRPRLARGVDYWERALFLPEGTPKYTPERTHPIDAHCYASAIDAWLAVRGVRPQGFERAERLARLLIERMLDPAGYVHFQRRRLWTSRAPFVRWTTAPSFRALAGLLLVRAQNDGADARLD